MKFFLPFCNKTDQILDVGSGSDWCTQWLRSCGYPYCRSLDLKHTADIVGDIRQWKQLGLRQGSFDVIFAFEILEHVQCLNEFRQLLRPAGLLMLTTPIPSRDWILRVLERLHLNQSRETPHCNLQDIRTLAGFSTRACRRVAGLAQWGVYEKMEQL